MRTSELTGPALDWAVAKAEGRPLRRNPMGSQGGHGWWIWEETPSGRGGIILSKSVYLSVGGKYSPSTNWSQGGPIIDREDIQLLCRHQQHLARLARGLPAPVGLSYFETPGPTKLIAAMRCFVASKLGDEVDVPEELQHT